MFDQSLVAGQSGEESSGNKPLTSLGSYRGWQQQSVLQLGAHELGHDPGHVCPEGAGRIDGNKGGGGASMAVGEQQAGLHCG